MPEIPPDIRQRIVDDFGDSDADEIYEHLLDRIPAGLPNGTRSRHLRCILYLAAGDRHLLEEAIKLCLSDPRDVMLQAEYENGPRGGLNRMRDFDRPFGDEDLAKGE